MGNRYKKTPINAASGRLRHRYRERVQNRGTQAFSPFRRNINFYETPILNHLTKKQRASLVKVAHIWRETDSYWKLAHAQYGDATYWWVIAMYNQAPTESHLSPGEQIYIPTSLTAVLSMLQVY